MTVSGSCRRFDGRLALVVGAGTGIGRACAARLAAEGAGVAIADLEIEAAAEALAGLPLSADGRDHLALRMDVTDQTSVDAGLTCIQQNWGRLDALVTVAGGDADHGDIESTDDDVWRRLFELNLLGTVRVVRAAVPLLARADPQAAIVMVGSVNGLTGLGSEPYSSAKAGLTSFAQNAAIQLGPRGIRVNVVAPGTIRTRVWDGQPGGADRMTPFYPLGRVGEPDDIAAAVAYLASSDASWVTGVTLPVEGGLLAGPRGTVTLLRI